MANHYLKELVASGENNKEPDDHRKGRSEGDIAGKFPSGRKTRAIETRLNRSWASEVRFK